MGELHKNSLLPPAQSLGKTWPHGGRPGDSKLSYWFLMSSASGSFAVIVENVY